MGDHFPDSRIDDERVPAPVVVGGVAVPGDGGLAALGLVARDGGLDVGDRVGAGLALGRQERVLGDAVFVPARAEDQVATPDGPAVLERLIAGRGVEDDVVDPLPCFRGGGEGGAVVHAPPVDADARRAQQLGAGGVGDGVEPAILPLLQDEDVPVAIDAFGGVVEVERWVEAFLVVAIKGLLDEVLGEGARAGLRDRSHRRGGGVILDLGDGHDGQHEGEDGEPGAHHCQCGHDAVSQVRHLQNPS